MPDRGLEVEQEPLVLRVVPGLLGAGAGEPLDLLHRVPERHRQEVRPVFFDPAQHVHAPVSLRRPVIGDAGLVQVIEVLVCPLGRHLPVPNPGDHKPSSTAFSSVDTSPSAISPVGSPSGSKMVTSMPTASPERSSARKASTNSAGSRPPGWRESTAGITASSSTSASRWTQNPSTPFSRSLSTAPAAASAGPRDLTAARS